MYEMSKNHIQISNWFHICNIYTCYVKIMAYEICINISKQDVYINISDSSYSTTHGIQQSNVELGKMLIYQQPIAAH